DDFLRDRSRFGFTLSADFLPMKFDKPALEKAEIDVSQVKHGLLGPPQVIGDASLSSWRRDGSTVLADLDVRAESRIVFPRVFYDFYRAEADGSKRLDLYPAYGRFGPLSTDGLMGVTVPPGTRNIKIYEVPSPPLKIGIAAFIPSLIGALLLDIITR